jgi:putative membrane protein
MWKEEYAVNATYTALHCLEGGVGFGYWDWGSGWPWAGLLWLVVAFLFWAGLMALLVWAVRSSAGPRGSRRPPDTAAQVLRQRLARGEISQEEYERIRQLLKD